MNRSKFKRMQKVDQSEFDHKYACWSTNHNGWSKMKKAKRGTIKTRLKRELIKEIDDVTKTIL